MLATNVAGGKRQHPGAAGGVSLRWPPGYNWGVNPTKLDTLGRLKHGGCGKGYVNSDVLVDCDWVEAHRNDENVKLVEVDVDTNAW